MSEDPIEQAIQDLEDLNPYNEAKVAADSVTVTVYIAGETWDNQTMEAAALMIACAQLGRPVFGSGPEGVRVVVAATDVKAVMTWPAGLSERARDYLETDLRQRIHRCVRWFEDLDASLDKTLDDPGSGPSDA